MVRQCEMCKTNENSHPELSFHRFPTDLEKKKIWASLLGFESFDFKKKLVLICSNHFDSNDIETRSNGSKFLKPDANPLPYHSAFEIPSESPLQDNGYSTESYDVKIEDFNNFMDPDGFNAGRVKDKECDNQDDSSGKINEPDSFKSVKKEGTVEEMVSEESIDLTEETHNCYLCHEVANININIERHIDSFHVKQYKCYICDFCGNDETSYQCLVDSLILKSENSIADFTNQKPHLKDMTLNSINQKRNKCPLCDFIENQGEPLKMHMKSIHPNFKKYKCDKCEYATNLRRDLNRHIESVHLRKYKCTLCDYVANKNCKLKNHIDTVHLNLKKYKCALCGYATNSKSNYDTHVDSIHLDLKKYQCEWCDFGANQKSNLKHHLEFVHLNIRHLCEKCEYEASSKGDLKKHVDAVHLNLKKIKCALCDFATNHRIQIRKHMNSCHSSLKT